MKTRIRLNNGPVVFKGSSNALEIFRKTMASLPDAITEEVPNGKFFSDLSAKPEKVEPLWAKDTQLEHFSLRLNSIVLTHHLKTSEPKRIEAESTEA